LGVVVYHRYFREIAHSLLALTLCACAGDDPVTARGGSSRGAAAGSGAANPGNPVGMTVNPNGGNVTMPNLATGPGGAKLDPNVCASADVTATRITPNVYLVIDGSSSMEARFGDGTRWSVLREALVGMSGVVTKLESVVKFGMTIYSNNDPMKCPATTEVKAGLNNLMNINAAYPMMETGGGTPTGEALQKVVEGLPDFNSPDSTEHAPIIILATDGEPNGCASAATCNWADWSMCLGMLLGQLGNAPATYDTTIAAVRAARAKKVPVWVISMADGLNNIPDLQKTANIGAGLADDASPGATIFSPKNTDELVQTLAKLIGAAVTCDVELAGRLNVSRACEGSVTMNTEKLVCNGDQGWKPLDEGHIQLQGAACDRFKSDPTVLLNAKFPCDVVVPQ
jgi:Mg-chelatase subunit ChlD